MQPSSCAKTHTEPGAAPPHPTHSCHLVIPLYSTGTGLSSSFSHPFLFLPYFHFLSEVKSPPTLVFPQFLSLHYPHCSFISFVLLFHVIPSPIRSAASHNHTVLSLKNHALTLQKSESTTTLLFPSNYYNYFIYLFLETHVGCQV